MENKVMSVEKVIRLHAEKYQSPHLDVMEVVVEQGFASSSSPSSPPSSAPDAGGTGEDLPWG